MKTDLDVMVIGSGPAGEVLVSTLGEAGLRVLLVDRWPTPYPLPRLTSLDGESCRIVQATSKNVDEAFALRRVLPDAVFADGDGEPLMRVLYPGTIGGWPNRSTIFQPDFEKGISDKIDTMPNVETRRGWEAVDIAQDQDTVTLSLVQLDPATMKPMGALQMLTAKYLVGADGARSFVRRKLDLPIRDYNLHERWLNFDAEILRPLPERFSELVIYMDPKRPHMFMPIGEQYLRLEFRVMENETDEEVIDPAIAWQFLTDKHGLGPDDVRIMRQVVYHYHPRIADRWNEGRVFLAGDSAHSMPPYMGQGGNSAIRDARNLGWKLVEVLAGHSPETLLQTYQEEREPHVTTIVMGSDMLSRAVNITDPFAASMRNKGMREQGDRTPPETPSLTAGVLHRLDGNTVRPPSGLVAPQGTLRHGGWTGRGDDLLGTGFQIWSRRDPETFLDALSTRWIEQNHVGVAVFEDETSDNHVEDCEGAYVGFLNAHQVDFIIIRPDFIVFGGVAQERARDLIADLSARLSGSSVERADQDVLANAPL